MILIKIPYVEDANIFRKYLQFEEESFAGRQKYHVMSREDTSLSLCSPQFVLIKHYAKCSNPRSNLHVSLRE